MNFTQAPIRAEHSSTEPTLRQQLRSMSDALGGPLVQTTTRPRFADTSCSQCGCDLGPGDAGVSSCRQHHEGDARRHMDNAVRRAVQRLDEAARTFRQAGKHIPAMDAEAVAAELQIAVGQFLAMLESRL